MNWEKNVYVYDIWNTYLICLQVICFLVQANKIGRIFLRQICVYLQCDSYIIILWLDKIAAICVFFDLCSLLVFILFKAKRLFVTNVNKIFFLQKEKYSFLWIEHLKKKSFKYFIKVFFFKFCISVNLKFVIHVHNKFKTNQYFTHSWHLNLLPVNTLQR